MKARLVALTEKDRRQAERQVRLSYFFIGDEMQQLRRLLRNRCPAELISAIQQLKRVHHLDFRTRADAIDIATSSALYALLLLNTEEESIAARRIIANIACASDDALTELALLRHEENALGAGEQVVLPSPPMECLSPEQATM